MNGYYLRFMSAKVRNEFRILFPRSFLEPPEPLNMMLQDNFAQSIHQENQRSYLGAISEIRISEALNRFTEPRGQSRTDL